MGNMLLVGIGGFLGSIMRFLSSTYIQQFTRGFDFPYGTLTVNILGCFLFGFFSQLADTLDLFSTESRNFIFIGVLGGFTTYSTFGNDTMDFFLRNKQLPAILNIGAHIFFGFIAIWLGRTLPHLMWK